MGPVLRVMAAILTVLLAPFSITEAEATWFIDAGRYHVSVHGQISCSECHGEIAESLHPDPGCVNRALNSFFKLGQCAGCHEDAIERLNAGVHAGKKVKDTKEYEVCISCHDPHYQLSTAQLPPAFDRSNPVSQQCGVCHAEKTALPKFPSADQGCVDCHRMVEMGDPDESKKIAAFCLKCHGVHEIRALLPFRTIDQQTYGSSTHSSLSCFACHRNSAEFGHDRQQLTACLACHNRHAANVAHDAHLDVSCEACHLSGIVPVRATSEVLWQIDPKQKQPSRVHDMTLDHGDSSCRRCHYQGNQVGAAAMVLPPKSILCMPCHAATFSFGDMTTIVSLILFVIGMGTVCAVWFSANRSTRPGLSPETRAHNAVGGSRERDLISKTLYVLKITALDVFLQRRLFRRSAARWFIHSMIFWPFVFRFLWGLTALLTSLWTPRSRLPWIMLDHNDPLGAFLFDLSGLMMLSGIVLTAVRKIVTQSEDLSGMPKPDWATLLLLGGIVVIGFVLEGMRIGMTGSPTGSGYAFAGYAISRLFVNTSSLPLIYGYIWYLHAFATGALLVYLPFSSLLHAVMAPVVLAMNAMLGKGGPR